MHLPVIILRIVISMDSGLQRNIEHDSVYLHDIVSILTSFFTLTSTFSTKDDTLLLNLTDPVERYSVHCESRHISADDIVEIFNVKGITIPKARIP